MLACALAWAAPATPTAASAPAARASTVTAKKPAPVPPIDVNSASKAQLKTLSGIGDAEAERIITGRPYLSKAEIVTKASIPEGTYVANKRKIVATQKAKPTGKKA